MSPPRLIRVTCKDCDEHCVLGTQGTESGVIIDLLIPVGWTPHTTQVSQSDAQSGTRLYFTCKDCSNPKAPKPPGKPTHPPPPRRHRP